MSNNLKGIDAFLGILKGKTNGARLSIEEINDAIAEAGAEAGMAGITPEGDKVNLSPADQTQRPNLNVTTESSDESANTTGAFTGHALREQDVIASGDVLADLTEAPKPTFLDDEGPSLDVPLFITKTNARELFGLHPGETVAQAAARKASEG
ncbi:hypothetical protein [Burkholderia pyrrocinia]|jgi:hypothetical protein|uniref:hypothetical protein n=1 Tax=Burkholderia pyrrocinia TaxID=60550 RepID=UPI001FC8C067|nr:hypothetical protein [Burkholderia pyrrocinia]